MNPEIALWRHSIFMGIFCTNVQKQCNEGKITFQQAMLAQLDMHEQNKKGGQLVSHNLALNSEWITDFNVRLK